MVRMSAEDRREGVILAAMSEFARGGYFGTSTEAIAKRVGVSQPYLFRLFPGKQAIFLAAVGRCVRDFKELFLQASEGLEGEAAKEAMGCAYLEMIAERPERLLMQMQTAVAVAASEAAGDREFGEIVRADWADLWDTVHLAIGADTEVTTTFMAHGMLINSLVAMGFPAGHRVWQGILDDGTKAAPGVNGVPICGSGSTTDGAGETATTTTEATGTAPATGSAVGTATAAATAAVTATGTGTGTAGGTG